jgi:hypothetical protein
MCVPLTHRRALCSDTDGMLVPLPLDGSKNRRHLFRIMFACSRWWIMAGQTWVWTRLGVHASGFHEPRAATRVDPQPNRQWTRLSTASLADEESRDFFIVDIFGRCRVLPSRPRQQNHGTVKDWTRGVSPAERKIFVQPYSPIWARPSRLSTTIVPKRESLPCACATTPAMSHTQRTALLPFVEEKTSGDISS